MIVPFTQASRDVDADVGDIIKLDFQGTWVCAYFFLPSKLLNRSTVILVVQS